MPRVDGSGMLGWLGGLRRLDYSSGAPHRAPPSLLCFELPRAEMSQRAHVPSTSTRMESHGSQMQLRGCTVTICERRGGVDTLGDFARSEALARACRATPHGLHGFLSPQQGGIEAERRDSSRYRLGDARRPRDGSGCDSLSSVLRLGRVGNVGASALGSCSENLGGAACGAER